jgi:hypothetical protein
MLLLSLLSRLLSFGSDETSTFILDDDDDDDDEEDRFIILSRSRHDKSNSSCRPTKDIELSTFFAF